MDDDEEVRLRFFLLSLETTDESKRLECAKKMRFFAVTNEFLAQCRLFARCPFAHPLIESYFHSLQKFSTFITVTLSLFVGLVIFGK